MIHAFIIGSASPPWGEMKGMGLTDQSHTMNCDGKCSNYYQGAVTTCLKMGSQSQLGPHASLQSGVAISTPKAAPIHPNKPIVLVKCRRFMLHPISSPPNDHHQRWEPAADDVGVVADVNGWLSSAACCGWAHGSYSKPGRKHWRFVIGADQLRWPLFIQPNKCLIRGHGQGTLAEILAPNDLDVALILSTTNGGAVCGKPCSPVGA